jgi:hypothetical protein
MPHIIVSISDTNDKLRPRRIRRKSFESLPFSLKGQFSKIVYMYKLHYPRLIVSMLKEPPIFKIFFVVRGMIPCGTTFEFEYLGEFKMDIKNILGHESGAHMGLIHEKNRGKKYRATVPLRSFV